MTDAPHALVLWNGDAASLGQWSSSAADGSSVALSAEPGPRGAALRIAFNLVVPTSWVIARRALPLQLETVNGLVGGLMSLSPIDLWPIQNTSSFELRPGATELPPTHPLFHTHYREAGAFPGTDGIFTTKEILTRLYKVVGAPLTPIL